MASINERLFSRLDAFRSNSTFVDVVLRYNEDEYLAHRIFLAKYSAWFRDYFKNEQESGKVLEANERVYIDLPENPNGAMLLILNALYSGHLKITISNAPDLLKVSVFYGFNQFSQLIRSFVKKTLTEQTCLEYAQQFIQHDLIDDAKSLCKFIAEKLVDDFTQVGVPHAVNKKNVFAKITDGRVFAEILKNPVFNDLIKDKKGNDVTILSEDDKVRLIDEYIGDRVVDLIEEQEALASVIDWTTDYAHTYLVRYRCDWVPASISRYLYNKILDFRRNDVTVFEKDCESAAPTLSRWFPFSWFQFIADAIPTTETPIVDVNKFISTLGGCASQFNPIDYGMINTEIDEATQSQGNVLYPAKYIVEDSPSFFAAYTNLETKQVPAAVLNYGKHVKIQSTDIYINPCVLIVLEGQTPVKYITRSSNYQPIPDQIIVTTNNKDTFANIRKPATKEIATVIPYNQTFTEIKFSLKPQSPYQLLRLLKVDIRGKFLQN